MHPRHTSVWHRGESAYNNDAQPFQASYLQSRSCIPSDPSALKKTFQHLLRLKDLPGDCERRPTVAFVIDSDRGNGLYDLFHCRKREQSLAAAIMCSEACFLSYCGAASCQIADRAVAKPASVQPYILVLGTGKLPLRATDVVAIPVPIDAQVMWQREFPTILKKLLSLRFPGNLGG